MTPAAGAFNRLLVVRMSALGDVIHTIPAVVALRDALPGVQIGWVVERAYRELVEIVVKPDATFPVRLRGWRKSLVASSGEIAATMSAIRRFGEREASIDFQGLIKSAVPSFLSGARLRFGFDREAVREKPSLLFTNRHVRVDPAAHVVDQNLQLASAAAGRPLEHPTVDFSPFADDSAGKLRDLGGRVVLLPGAGKASKLWPTASFRVLAKHLGARALVVWGPGEEELAKGIGAEVAPPTNLRELAWLLKHARAVVGADTGPLHLADALGTPSIALFGPTIPWRNGPHRHLDLCVSVYDGDRSMASIEPAAVIRRVDEVLAR